MSSNDKDRVTICVRNVDRDTWANFHAYLIREHGKVKGAAGEVLSRALDNWMHDAIKSSIITRSTRGDVKATEDKIVARLESAAHPEVTDRMFCELCQNIGLLDTRTHRRYLKALLGRQVLSYKATSSSGVTIYRVNHEHYAHFPEASHVDHGAN